MPNTTGQYGALHRAIQQTGYYPELVLDTVQTAIGEEEITSHVVHHEATFDHDELRRHITVMVLTASRLIVGHVDEHTGDGFADRPMATVSTEIINLARIQAVIVSRLISDPAQYRGNLPDEVVITVSWGFVSRVEMEPARCPDPSCEADHGYSGTITNEDFALRFSQAADGEYAVRQALNFAQQLSAVAAR